jgi:hypothetical protein
MIRTLLIALPLLLLSYAPASARPFGEKGQYIVTTAASLDYQRDTISSEGPTPVPDVVHTEYSFHVAGDYTSFRRVTFGVDFGLEGDVRGMDSVKSFRFGGRTGYVVPLGSYAALWPRLGASFGNTTYLTSTEQVTVRGSRLTASLPVMFNPYPQVLIGVGPTFDHDLTASGGIGLNVPRQTGFGVHMTLGFWFE